MHLNYTFCTYATEVISVYIAINRYVRIFLFWIVRFVYSSFNSPYTYVLVQVIVCVHMYIIII